MSRSRSILLASCLAMTACGGASTRNGAQAREALSEDARADRLLVASRALHWAFPTSSGRPTGKETPEAIARFVAEREDVVAAGASLMRRHRRADAAELAANTWRIFVLAHEEAKGRAFLASVLDAPDADDRSTRHRALAAYGDGLLAFRLGDLSGSKARSLEAWTLARRAVDGEAEGLALLGLSRADLSSNRGREAYEHAREAAERLHDLGDGYRQAPLHMVAQAARLLGNLEEAAGAFRQSVALNRKLDDLGMVEVELHNLGHVELRRGNVDEAERLFREGEALAGPTNDPYDLALRIFNRASVAYSRHDARRAKELLGEARALLKKENVELADDDARELDDLEKRLAADAP